MGDDARASLVTPAEADAAAEKWWKLGEASSQTGLTVQQIRSRALRGEITTKQVGRETVYAAASFDLSTDSDNLRALCKQLLAGIVEGQKQNRELVSTIINGAGWMKTGIDTVLEMNARLAKRNADLEVQWDAARIAIEAARTQEHERAIAREKADSEKKMRFDLFVELKRLAPHILSALSFHFFPRSRSVQESLLCAKLAEVGDAEFSALISSMNLPDLDRIQLHDMRKALRAQERLLPPSNGKESTPS